MRKGFSAILEVRLGKIRGQDHRGRLGMKMKRERKGNDKWRSSVGTWSRHCLLARALSSLIPLASAWISFC